MINLHLGCGEKKIDGFINVDALPTSAADLVCGIQELKNYFESNSVDYIYACHVLEHFSRHEYFSILQDLYQILKPQGMIRISVPDLEALMEYYVATKNLNEVRGTIFGGQRNSLDFHCWGWDFESLKNDLTAIGFTNIQRYDPFNTSHTNVRDWSKDFVPRHDAHGNQLPDEIWFQGKLVSLNVQAIKPGECK